MRGRVGALVLLGVACGLGVMWAIAGGPSWYGVAAVGLYSAKIVLSWRPYAAASRKTAANRTAASRTAAAGEDAGPAAAGGSSPGPGQDAATGLRIGVAVPVYNEDPAMLGACLKSLLAQSRPVQSVVVIDDCSSDARALDEARAWGAAFAAAGVKLIVEAFPENRGKRHGLMRALELQPDAQALLGVDSDTILRSDAVEKLVAAYAQPGVKVVTGLVLALNYDKNLLTRLIDLRYAQAFLVDRGAQSRLGAMLCACGSLALYSAQVLRKYRKDFLNQHFLGRAAVFGDDRRLTNYCLLEGRAILEESAVAYTAVPERMGHFLRQQVRWNKSFFRESLWVLRAMPVTKAAFWFTFAEISSWFVFTISLAVVLVIAPLVTAQLLLGPYLLYLALIAYGRAFRYPDLAGVRVSRKDRLIGFAIAPVYGLLHVGVLVWLRLYALATLRSGRWGTRKKIEVRLAGPASAALAA
ncbi:MAG: glycosyltransferase [Propionibacteriaceae bacterium]|jgi:hyaluronan synthase|nr:glycosyltransferase [Propionibacteriaceae bacterium]